MVSDEFVRAVGLVELADGRWRHQRCGRYWETREAGLGCTDLNADDAVTSIEDAKAAAAEALATGRNARQMVLNRDPTLASVDERTTTLADQQAALVALAQSYEATVADSVADRAALHAELVALRALVLAQRVTIKSRTVAVPQISILAGQVDVTVTWDAPFSDDAYSVYPPSTIPLGVALLGRTDAVVKSKTAAAVVVTVRASALVTAGQVQVSVLAYRQGA